MMKNARTIGKKILALLLCVFMLSSASAVFSYAEENAAAIAEETSAEAAAQATAAAKDGAAEAAVDNTAQNKEASTETAVQNTTNEENTSSESVTNITQSNLSSGAYTISQNGVYQLASSLEAAITIDSGVTNVTIKGNGVSFNQTAGETYGEIDNNCTPNAVTIDATDAQSIQLTLQDLYNKVTTETASVLDFAGAGNTLTIEGTVLMDYMVSSTTGTKALIHAGAGTALSITGTGTYYQAHNTDGAGIGGNSGEANGTLTFAMTGAAFIKSNGGGAAVGSGKGAGESASAGGSTSANTPGDITFESGEVNMVADGGAAVGGYAGTDGMDAAGTNIYLTGATVSVNADSPEALIGGGTLYYESGSLRPYVDSKAIESGITNDSGISITATGVDKSLITATPIGYQNALTSGKPLYFYVVNTAMGNASTDGTCTVSVDNYHVYESGRLHHTAYLYSDTETEANRPESPLSTPGNWAEATGEASDNNVYLFLTGEDHTLKINNKTVNCVWDAETKSFILGAAVSFAVSPQGADITVSKGLGYTYTEDTMTGYTLTQQNTETGTETTIRRFLLEPGNYTATITQDGYYASEFSFVVGEDNSVSGVSDNVDTILDANGLFTLTLTEMKPSTEVGAWDGKTLDVSWYTEGKTEFLIDTPKKLMGMAAIVNGIYNAEITTIIDDVNGDGTTETYTPREYAALKNKKIRPKASDSEDTSGPNGNNQVTTDTYWYGVQSDNETPADFNGKTVKLACSIDLGGVLIDGVWGGARAMSIGGQSLMHFISIDTTKDLAVNSQDKDRSLTDYPENYSDGYSHLGSSFNGTLDGQGHVVKNMYMNRYAGGASYGDSTSVGLIGRLGLHDKDPAEWAAVNPTVKNIAVTGYVYGRRSVGGIVGKIGRTSANPPQNDKGGTAGGDGSTGGRIFNCVNLATVKKSDSKGVGGIVGASWNAGIVKNCVNFGYIYNGYQKRDANGGISGSSEVPTVNCYNVGYVDGFSHESAQAICTNNGGASVDNCYWLKGSSYADSVDSYAYPAVYGGLTTDTVREISSYSELQTKDFINQLSGAAENSGIGRGWAVAASGDDIYAVLQKTTFLNCKLNSNKTSNQIAGTLQNTSDESVTAECLPVPRVFTNNDATVTEVELKSNPSNLNYVEGQTFDPTGLSIVATYDDGTSEFVEDYTVSKTEPLSTEDASITVSGTVGSESFEYEYTFSITVVQDELMELKISKNPANMLYAANEDFDPAGMEVSARYKKAEDDWEVVSQSATGSGEDGYTYPTTGNTLTVSYTYKGKTQTAELTITRLSGKAPALDESGRYQIGSEDELRWFANQVEALKQTTIDAVVTQSFSAGSAFTGIGGTSAYAGTFDGGGHTVTVAITRSGTAGFFNNAGTATEGEETVHAVIQNLTVAGSVESTGSSKTGCGALVGTVSGETEITNCVNTAAVSGSIAGGLAGSNDASALTVTSCQNSGTVTGSKYAGGLVGSAVKTSITGCMNTGTVSSTAVSGGAAGGILGHTDANERASANTLTQCGNKGSVTVSVSAGGLVGRAKDSYINISSCYNKGVVTATGLTAQTGAGGIIGTAQGYVQKITAEDVYNWGAVSATKSSATSGIGGAGGIVGYAQKGFTLTNVYTSGDVTTDGSGNVKGGTLVGYGGSAKDSTLTKAFSYDGLSLTATVGAFGTSGACTETGVGRKTAAGLRDLKPLFAQNGKSSTAWMDANSKTYALLAWEDKAAEMADWKDLPGDTEPVATQSMYRLYNPNSGEHFYTADSAEKDMLVKAGWNYEGPGWTAPEKSNTPVYRMYNPNPSPKTGSGEHHYTTNAAEREMLINAGWTDEGIGWYSDDSQGTPLYRLYNPNEYNNNHHYTTSTAERDYLLGLGWRDEGIAWYGVE